jgi:hypothetical protein
VLPLSRARLHDVRAVFTDVDGTLTTDGRLTSSTLLALETLSRHRVEVVLVSGRPAGWGECWARQLPVAAVITENGGVTHVRTRRGIEKRFAERDGQRQRHRTALLEHVTAAMASVKGARLSMDSAATEVDLAIDYAEDVQLGPTAAIRLEDFLRARGVKAVRSSVHVNCWLGDFDKRTAVERFLERQWKTSLEVDESRFVYVGDSFNDQPMFVAFPLSIGVANIKAIAAQLEHPPAFVTRSPEGKGFGEVARAVLRARRTRKAAP